MVYNTLFARNYLKLSPSEITLLYRTETLSINRLPMVSDCPLAIILLVLFCLRSQLHQ